MIPFVPGGVGPGAHPVFSPDGTKIAFGFEPVIGNDDRIHLMDADGENNVPITDNDDINDVQPAWQRTFAAETTGVYVPSTGEWLLRNSNTAGDPDIVVTVRSSARD
jgi:hypothetical protein